MKRKTSRRINKIAFSYFIALPFGIFAASIGIVITILRSGNPLVQDTLAKLLATNLQPIISNLFPKTQPVSDWVWIIFLWIIIIGLLLLVTFFLSNIVLKASTLKGRYFEEIVFGSPDETTIQKAVEGMLNTEKVESFYVHAAPKVKEVENVLSEVKKCGFVVISGGPGEGKSMTAFHTAYRFHKEANYRCYRLKLKSLEGKSDETTVNKVLSELDGLKGKRFFLIFRNRKKLIIVDDAHNLAVERDLNLRQEAVEGNGKYIRIETEYYQDKRNIKSTTAIRLNFPSFVEILVNDFYRSRNPIIRKALQGRIEGLDDAIQGTSQGKIRDAWLFNFVATQGDQRLSQEIEDLSDIELLVLFIISAYTVLSGESELYYNTLLNKLSPLAEIGWINEALRQVTFKGVIETLQKQTENQKSLIKIYNKLITSFHYRFARAVIRASASRDEVINDLLSSLDNLLEDEYNKCVYIGVLLKDIYPYSMEFIRSKKDWLVDFINNPLLEKLHCYSALLVNIKKYAQEIYTEIIKSLDINKIAGKASGAEARQFASIENLVVAFGDQSIRLEFINNLDVTRLVENAHKINAEQLQQIVHLYHTLGNRRDELIEKLDLATLGRVAARAEHFEQLIGFISILGIRKELFIENLFQLRAFKKFSEIITRTPYNRFMSVVDLLDSLGDKKASLIELLNFDKLVENTKMVGPDGLPGLTRFLACLDEDNRNRLLQEINWTSLCMKCPISADSLGVLGRCVKNLWKQAQMLSDSSAIERIRQYLQSHKNNIVKVMEDAIEQTPDKNYSGIARFLSSCNYIDTSLACEIANKIIRKRINNLCIRPYNYLYAAQLINVFYEIDPKLSELFLSDRKVQNMIRNFIKGRDWTEEVDNLKFLVKAIYHALPTFWHAMIEDPLIFLAVSPLDLNSLYKEANGEINLDPAQKIALLERSLT